MAVPTLTNTPTIIDTADATTNWSGGSAEPDVTIDENGSISETLRANGATLSVTTSFTSAGNHVRGWFQFTAVPDLDFIDFELNGGTATYILFDGPGGTNSGSGVPRYRGGWFYVLVDLDATPDSGTVPTTTTSIGYEFNRVSQPRNVINTFADVLWRGDGYTCTGGTSGDPITFETIASADASAGLYYGVVQTVRDTTFIFGAVTIGAGATATYCTVANEAIIFDDQRLAATDLYKIIATGSGATFDATNSLFKGNGAQTFDFDMSAVNTLICDTNVLIQAVPTFGSSQSVESCTFINCGLTTGGGATFTGCTFDESTSASSLTLTALTQIVDCEFMSDGSNNAVELTGTVPSEYTWNHTSSGYLAGSLGDFTTGTNVNATLYINPSATSTTDLILNIPIGTTVPSIRFGANYSGTVTVRNAPKTIDVNVKDEDGVNVSGAFVWLNDGVITIFNGTTDASGNIPQQDYVGSNNTTLRVRRFGDKPFETTLGTSTSSVSQLVTLVNDRQQVAVPTLNQTYTINTTASTITVSGGSGSVVHTDYTTLDTAQNLYEFVMNTFAATAFMEFSVPLESITNNQYNFINGFTFGAKDIDYKYIYEGSFTDTANNLLWSNVKTIGTQEAGTSIYIVQGVEASDAALTSWWPDGNINVLVKVEDGTFIQSTDDTATNVNGGVWLFAREYGDLYDHFFSDLSNGGQNIVALSTLPDLNNETASGTVAGYTNVTTTFGSTSQDIGDGAGNQPYNVIVDCANRPLTEVYERLKYITSFDFSATVDGDDGFEYRNANETAGTYTDTKQSPFGTFAGGKFFGARGVWLNNIPSADANNIELLDANNVVRTPPLTASFVLTGLKDGTEIRIHDYADDSVIAGVEDMTGGTGTSTTSVVGTVTISGSTDDNTFTYNYPVSTPVSVYVRVLNLNYIILSLGRPVAQAIVLDDENISIPISQQIDRNYLDE